MPQALHTLRLELASSSPPASSSQSYHICHSDDGVDGEDDDDADGDGDVHDEDGDDGGDC